MASNETNSLLEAMSAALRAATKLTNDNEKSEKLTPDMLAGAIKLAALSTDNQEKLTPTTVNAAIKVIKNTAGEEEEQQQQQQQQHNHLTPQSLAIALKLATKASSTDDKDTDDMSTDQMLAAMKAAMAMTHQDHSDELATSEILSHALELAKK